MAYMPDLMETSTQPYLTYQFEGYNHNPVISDGQMYDMTNMSGDRYPLLAPRQKKVYELPRSNFTHPEGYNFHSGIMDNGNLYTAFRKIDDTELKIYASDRYTYEAEVYRQIDHYIPSQSVTMGSDIFYFPDHVKYNMLTGDISTTEHIPMDSSLTGGIDDILRLLNLNEATERATKYPDFVLGAKVNLVFDFTKMHTNDGSDLDDEQIASLNAINSSEQRSITKVYTDGFIEFKVDDGVGDGLLWIGFTGPEFPKKGLHVTAGAIMVSVHQEAPEFDCACEHNNRLWGARYSAGTKPINEIYASALGDGTVWDLYEGTNADSWTASVGMSGKFTGCTEFNDDVLFFKADAIITVSGSNPSSFSTHITSCSGCIDARSIQVIGGCVYYLSAEGVMKYDGTVPYCISKDAGIEIERRIPYYESTKHNSKYFICLPDRIQPGSVQTQTLFEYETIRGTWHAREKDVFNPPYFYRGSSAYHNLPGARGYDEDIGMVVIYDAQRAADDYPADRSDFDLTGVEPDFDWEAVTGISGYEFLGDPNNLSRYNLAKQSYLSRYCIRMQMYPGSKLCLWIEYDSDGNWHKAGEITGKSLRSYMIPVVPTRCDHCRLKLTGKGRVEIYSIARIYEAGGDGAL